ncbi:MAG: TraR/DksA C4-type zinc finger protein [Microgenomates group bacterium]
MVQKNKQVTVSFPKSLLVPIQKFLESEVIRWKKTEKNMKKNDPFSDNNRLAQNSVEEDVDEQVGHFETEVKVSFIKKQLVQLRKALTMIKFGKYGICEKCGKMIDTDRLAVKPEVTVCIKCAQEQE